MPFTPSDEPERTAPAALPRRAHRVVPDVVKCAVRQQRPQTISGPADASRGDVSLGLMSGEEWASFDLALVDRRMGRLGAEQRVAFAVFWAQRLWPMYRRFVEAGGSGNPARLQRCLDLAWWFAGGRRPRSIDLDACQHELQHLAPAVWRRCEIQLHRWRCARPRPLLRFSRHTSCVETTLGYCSQQRGPIRWGSARTTFGRRTWTLFST